MCTLRREKAKQEAAAAATREFLRPSWEMERDLLEEAEVRRAEAASQAEAGGGQEAEAVWRAEAVSREEEEVRRAQLASLEEEEVRRAEALSLEEGLRAALAASRGPPPRPPPHRRGAVAAILGAGDHYSVLGLDRAAGPGELRRAYRCPLEGGAESGGPQAARGHRPPRQVRGAGGRPGLRQAAPGAPQWPPYGLKQWLYLRPTHLFNGDRSLPAGA
jgi:hypothetical protein